MKYLTLTLLLFFLNNVTYATTIAGIEMPNKMEIRDHSLYLNGTGTRTKFFLDIYAAGLYLPQHTTDDAQLVKQDRPMALRLHILSSLLSSEKMEKATKEGFEIATGNNVAPISTEIDLLINAFNEDIVKNDVFEFIYIPNEGMQVLKNGVVKVTLEGLTFKEAFFSIWLGKKPAQKSLKKALLAK
ncbi:chalcone isomerase [Marinomonas agarivorans]|nr:chalcone isomerase [Marinomonas agarivorans]